MQFVGLKPKTCVRYNEPGHAHALTFSCWHGQAFLAADRAKDLFVKAIEAARLRHRFDVWAYVIMPEHVHLVVCPREDSYSISRILHALKRPMSFSARRAGLRFGDHFWQPGGGYDRNLWKAATVHREIDYIHANPVRRGLCQSPEDCRYSSAGFWAGQEDVPLLMSDSLPPRELA